MSSPESTNDETGSQRASDAELREILFRAKEDRGLPALLTSQINEIGGWDYSGTALNGRLFDLHEKGQIGHKKAAGRHMWWSASEGTTTDVELPSLEDLVDTDKIDPTRFSEEQAKEIAKQSIPGYEQNWWQRVYYSMDGPFRFGAASFVISLVLLTTSQSAIPNLVLEVGIIFGLLSVIGSAMGWILSIIGAKLAARTSLPEEPWGGDDFIAFTTRLMAPDRESDGSES